MRLILYTQSEETPCPLINVVRVSSEIFHKQDFNLLCYILPADWFEQYREKVIEAEQMVLTTLNFELNVQHPYAHLTSMLEKLGLAQSLLVNLALSLISERERKREQQRHRGGTGGCAEQWWRFSPWTVAAATVFQGTEQDVHKQRRIF